MIPTIPDQNEGKINNALQCLVWGHCHQNFYSEFWLWMCHKHLFLLLPLWNILLIYMYCICASLLSFTHTPEDDSSGHPTGHMEDHELTPLLVPSVIVPSKQTILTDKLKEAKVVNETISPLNSPLWSGHRLGYLEIYLWLLVTQCHSPTLDTCGPKYGYCHEEYFQIEETWNAATGIMNTLFSILPYSDYQDRFIVMWNGLQYILMSSTRLPKSPGYLSLIDKPSPGESPISRENTNLPLYWWHLVDPDKATT